MVDVTFNGRVQQAVNGKHYMSISGLQTNSLDVSRVLMNIKFNDVANLITDTVSRVANANWRIIKPSVDPAFKKIAGTTIQALLTSFLDNVSMEEVFTQF